MPWMRRWQGRCVAGRFTEVTLGVIKVPQLRELCQQRGMPGGFKLGAQREGRASSGSAVSSVSGRHPLLLYILY